MANRVNLGSQLEKSTGLGYVVYTNGTGVPGYELLEPKVKASETLTSVTYDAETGLFTYTDEAGQVTNVNLPVENFLSNATYDQASQTLTLTLNDNTSFSVDLGELVDVDTVTTITRSGGTLTYTNESAVTFAFQEGGPSADAGNDLTAGSDGKPFFQEEITTLSRTGNTLTYVNEAGSTTNVSLQSGNYAYAEKVIGNAGTGANQSMAVTDAQTVIAVFFNGVQENLAASISAGNITIVEPTFTATTNGAGGNILSVLYETT